MLGYFHVRRAGTLVIGVPKTKLKIEVDITGHCFQILFTSILSFELTWQKRQCLSILKWFTLFVYSV